MSVGTHKQKFGHLNATNRNSYLNNICVKLVTQVEKTLKKIKTHTFYLRFYKKIKKPRFLKPTSTALGPASPNFLDLHTDTHTAYI